MKKTNKKGQFIIPLATFIFVVLGILVVSIILIRITNSVLTPFSSAINNVSAGAGDHVTYVQTSFTNFWDFVIVIAFLINVILLLVSAFLVDTHPLFVVLYILSCFFLLIFAPEMISAIDGIFDNAQFIDQIQYIPMTDFIRSNFSIVILGIMILSGVVMYAKVKMFGGGTPRR